VDPNRRLLYDTQKKVYEPVAAFVREHDTRFFSGDTVTRTIDVFNDGVHAHDLVLKCSLGAHQQSHRLELEPAGYRPVEIEFDMPTAEAKHSVEFLTELYADGKMVHRQSKTYSVEPRLRIEAPRNMRLLAYDPQGKLPADIPCRELRALDDLAGADPNRAICVVGPRALVQPEKSEIPVVGSAQRGAASLVAFLSRGGRALVLEQETFAGLPLNVDLVRHSSTMTFPVAPGHPVLKGLVADDLKFWRRGHYVSQREMRRPTSGGGRPLVVSGGDDSVAQGPLLEMPVGRGTVILCQALVAEKLDTEPAARRLLQNMLDHLADVKTRQAATAVVCESDAFVNHLEGLGLAFERAKGPLTEEQARACDVLVLHGGGEIVLRSREAIRAFVGAGKSGRALYWHAPDAETFAKMRVAIGCAGMDVVPANGPLVMKDRSHELLRGVCREDLVYVGKPRGKTWQRGFEQDPTVVDRALIPAASDSASAQRFEAERMEIEGKITRVADAGVLFATMGSATKRVRIARPGTYRITVLAGGSAAAGVFPVAAIGIDGKAVARVALMQGDTRAYVAMADLPAGEHQLSVAFVNDAQIGGEDRNMFLDAVLLDREPMAKTEVEFLTLPTSLAVRNTNGVRVIIDGIRWDTNERNRTKGRRYASTLLGNLGCSFGMPEGGIAWVSTESFEPVGTIPYFKKTKSEVALVAAGTVQAQFKCERPGLYRVFVRGRSTPAFDEYGKALVKVDGDAVCEVVLGARTVNVFRGDVAQLGEGMHELTVSFTNDIWRDGQDRNLYLSAVGFAPVD